MTDEIAKAMEPFTKAIQTVGTGSLENDKALLELCQAMIETMNSQTAMIKMHTEQILKLQEHHEALLTAFYSHCQETSFRNIN